jgi:hypothetical protein
MPSSVIRGALHDPDSGELTVTFMSGRVYIYLNVPAEVHAAFTSAASKGEFFNRFIRDHFRFREVARAG